MKKLVVSDVVGKASLFSVVFDTLNRTITIQLERGNYGAMRVSLDKYASFIHAALVVSKIFKGEWNKSVVDRLLDDPSLYVSRDATNKNQCFVSGKNLGKFSTYRNWSRETGVFADILEGFCKGGVK